MNNFFVEEEHNLEEEFSTVCLVRQFIDNFPYKNYSSEKEFWDKGYKKIFTQYIAWLGKYNVLDDYLYCFRDTAIYQYLLAKVENFYTRG